jgi:hypothetical protein
MRNIWALVVTVKPNYCNYCMKWVVSHNISLWNIDGHNMRITSGCPLKQVCGMSDVNGLRMWDVKNAECPSMGNHRRDRFSVLFVCLLAPLVCGWYTVDILRCTPVRGLYIHSPPFRVDSTRTLGQYSDYFWLRVLPNQPFQSKLVQALSEQTLGVQTES